MFPVGIVSSDLRVGGEFTRHVFLPLMKIFDLRCITEKNYNIKPLISWVI